MLVLCEETLFFSARVQPMYNFFKITPFDFVDYVFWIAAKTSIYNECGLEVFECSLMLFNANSSL